MKNVVFTRIDDRLLHGQVIVSWIPFLNINEIIIVDDEYAQDDFMATIIKDAAPKNISVNVLSVLDAVKYLNSENNGKRLLILTRFVEIIDNLVKMDAPIKSVNLGGLGHKDGSNKFHKSIYLTDKELDILKEISSKGISVSVQMLPGDKAIEILQ